MRIELAGPLNVDEVWPHIADGVIKSCRQTCSQLAPGILWQMCRSGNAYLFVALDEKGVSGSSIWQFLQGFHGCEFRALALSGQNAEKWLPEMYDMILATAKMGGASRLIDAGRPGLGRLYRRIGIPHREIGRIYEVKI